MIIAIVMAGGKSERLKVDCEKPLFPLKDKVLIEYVLDNLKESKFIEKIVVAVSPHTPKTNKYIMEKFNFPSLDFNSKKISQVAYLETPGNGYVEDLSFILNTFNQDSDNHILLFINSDLPLVNHEIIDYVLEEYKKSNKSALSVLVPVKIFQENNLDYSFEFNGLVPSGLNILLSQNVVQEEEKLIIPSIELAFNVNTIDTAISITKFL